MEHERVGEESYNNNGSLMRIIAYRKSDDIDIYFPEYDWVRYNCKYTNFKHGKVKCPYEPRYHGKGYLGEGEHKIKEDGKCTKCYRTWHHMLERCYDEKHREKYPTYAECYMNEEWLNYQNFADWFDDNYYEVDDELMCIDKDILCKGNKEYGPDTCVFTPENINLLFTRSDKIRGEYPIGVYEDKRRGKYVAKCQDGHSGVNYIGQYNTPEEAFEAYKEEKEFIIKLFAEAYKNDIPEELYNALYEYEVEIDD